jgi:hypothetical protein
MLESAVKRSHKSFSDVGAELRARKVLTNNSTTNCCRSHWLCYSYHSTLGPLFGTTIQHSCGMFETECNAVCDGINFYR